MQNCNVKVTLDEAFQMTDKDVDNLLTALVGHVDKWEDATSGSSAEGCWEEGDLMYLQGGKWYSFAYDFMPDYDNGTAKVFRMGSVQFPDDHYEYLACVRRMCLVEEDERYVELDEDAHTGDCYASDLFATEAGAIAFVKAEMNALVSGDLDGKGYKVIRTRNGLDSIEYCDGSVTRLLVSPDGDVLDHGDNPSTKHYYQGGYHESSLPDNVREKAMGIQSEYHSWLDYECDSYASASHVLS